MSCSWSPLATRGLSPSSCRRPTSQHAVIKATKASSSHSKPLKAFAHLSGKPFSLSLQLGKASSLAIQIGALITTVGQPVFAVTGENNNFDDDFTWTLIQIGIVAVWYFFVMPPVILTWLRLRWKQRKFFEMYFQFMFAFLFFPGLLLWAPFVNFRKLPRDPSMKYPWSTPQDLK
ncbi:NAD(P)H-quinone oxidoreductase subunit L, chloroplastic [Aristolochia californica]|uniref:NAD(P)H-quinone oxidoreductase subunit L, chloroplastic n=1 Tax=Aristolochia californica TaxID=171875 RepID=UPI0035DE456B